MKNTVIKLILSAAMAATARPAASGIPGKEWLCDWLQGANRSPASSVGTFGENRGRHCGGGHDGGIP